MSRFNTTSARLYFLSGPRLIDYLSSTHSFLTNTSSILSCGAPLVPERVAQVIEERKKADKRVTDLELELAKHISTELVSKAAAGNEIFKKHIHRIDDGGNPLAFLSAISFAFCDQIANAQTPYLLILTSTSSAQTTTSTTVVMVIGSDDKLVKAAGEALKSQMAVKGGGKGLKWSGKLIGVWKERKESDAVDIVLKSIQ